MAEAIPSYDELKLRIDRRTEGSYRVLAIGPDGSTAEGSFSLPFDEVELDNFVLRIGAARRGVRAYRSSHMEEAKRWGSTLFETLLQGDVREVYQRARSVADSREHGLRMTLYLTGVPELMEIPWEFMYQRPSFLSQSIYTPVVRSLDLKSVRPPRKVTLPLQILGLVSRPEGLVSLDVEDERNKLEAALEFPLAEGLVQLRWLERATLSELERAVSAPGAIHVLHYIGHGAYDARTQSGILVLENERGGPHEVTGEEFGSLLYDERSLQLVVLNSCEGARSSHVDPFSAVATSLVEYGFPAVVGMQFEITDDAAITFAERLYTALGVGLPIDAAVGQARKAIYAAGNDVEFGTPVLFLRTADARLFDIEAPPPSRLGELAKPPDGGARVDDDHVDHEPQKARAVIEEPHPVSPEPDEKPYPVSPEPDGTADQGRRKKLIASVAAALLLAVVVAVVVIARGDTSRAPPDRGEQAAEPESDLDLLLGTIPQSIRSTCAEVAPEVRMLAIVQCESGDPRIVRIRYRLFSSADKMNEMYYSWVRDHSGVPIGEGDSECGSTPAAEGTWRSGDQGGRVLCYMTDDTPTRWLLVWTNERWNTVNNVISEEPNGSTVVYEWWQDIALPAQQTD
jgi:CHAT domain